MARTDACYRNSLAVIFCRYLPLKDYFLSIKKYATVSRNFSEWLKSDLWLFLLCEKYTTWFGYGNGMYRILKCLRFCLIPACFPHFCGNGWRPKNNIQTQEVMHFLCIKILFFLTFFRDKTDIIKQSLSH